MWQAKFCNGEILDGYDGKGNEVLFCKVLDRLNDLESLSIILGTKKYTVYMSNGKFSTQVDNSDLTHFSACTADVGELTNIRPIYFIRETVKFGLSPRADILSKGGPTVNFTALGFQANLNGRNIKRYLAILPNGEYAIRDE